MNFPGRRRQAGSFATAEAVTSRHNALAVARRRGGDDDAPESLTAAGLRVKKREADSLRRLVQPWQSRSFAYYNMLGEIKYAAQFYSRALSQLRLYAAEIDENGDVVETTDPDAIAALERIQDPGGGRSMLLGAYGRLMFLTGEAYLFVSEDPETEMEQWEMLSTDELRIQGYTMMRYKAPSLPAEDFREPDDDDWQEVTDNKAVAYRLWQRHPQYSMLADSTMQGVLDLCEELVILTRAVRSRARSRLAGSGLLFIDERISKAAPDVGRDEDPLEDPFIAALTLAMTAPIADEGSASSVVPMLVRVPVPDGMNVKDMVAHLQIVDPTQLYPETGLRYECIKRIAIGLDMPAEILLGIMDANHWTGWMIDEQAWKAHLQPKAQQLVDDLTAAYMRPALKSGGKAEWAKYLIAYDATAIINHPDRTKDAKDLHDRNAIGDEALRDAAGFDEEDAPTDEERNRWLGVKIRDGSLAVYGIPSVKAGGLEPAAGELESPNGTTTDVAVPAAVEPGPPRKEPLPENVVGSANGHGIDAQRVLAAADLALLRARELAGNRLRGLARKDAAAAKRIDGVRARDVAAVLGRETVHALGAPSDRQLVSGVAEFVGDALRLWNITDDKTVELVVRNVEEHAIRTLYEPRPSPLPSSFTNYVFGLAAVKR